MNCKKIAIITWIGSGNYGTCLQSFALSYKLKEMGYDPSFLLQIPNFDSRKKLAKGYLKYFFKKIKILPFIESIRFFKAPLNIIKLKTKCLVAKSKIGPLK